MMRITVHQANDIFDIILNLPYSPTHPSKRLLAFLATSLLLNLTVPLQYHYHKVISIEMGLHFSAILNFKETCLD